MTKITRLPLTPKLIMKARAGLKPMSRRVIVPQPTGLHDLPRCPYGAPGDLLALTENFRFVEPPTGRLSWYEEVQVEYLADNAIRRVFLSPDYGVKVQDWKQPYKGKPPMYMGLDLCRAWARLTEVRAERVQDIPPGDILLEGVSIPEHHRGELHDPHRWRLDHWAPLWDSINAGRGYPYASNPWVWVLRWDLISTDGRPA